MRINNAQKELLKQMMQSEGFDVFLTIVNLCKDKIASDEIKRDDQFNTIWTAANNDGKIKGIDLLLKTLDDYIND